MSTNVLPVIKEIKSLDCLQALARVVPAESSLVATSDGLDGKVTIAYSLGGEANQTAMVDMMLSDLVSAYSGIVRLYGVIAPQKAAIESAAKLTKLRNQEADRLAKREQADKDRADKQAKKEAERKAKYDADQKDREEKRQKREADETKRRQEAEAKAAERKAALEQKVKDAKIKDEAKRKADMEKAKLAANKLAGKKYDEPPMPKTSPGAKVLGAKANEKVNGPKKK